MRQKNFIWQKLKRKKSSQLMMSIFDNDFRQMTHFFAHFRLLQMFLFLVITQLVFYSIFNIFKIHILHKNLLLCWFVSWSSSKHWIVASFCCPFISSNVLKTVVFVSAPSDFLNGVNFVVMVMSIIFGMSSKHKAC